ncbi:MAG: YicC family protein [Bacteroidales bacterium]|nr:YicC family protein [Bacteroidales bacterium]MDY5900883.1 YicC/YloC family endoribonuclease [Candidatus Limisoma sp.]MDY6000461.1 YicC/YloC family endoribonuclease [Candidatus Limisoma sp.]MDY6105917.1 YicC/YloC family endoribonuclease [Candidatus Limisoma sp.]
MILSMTGFGSSVAECGELKFTAEIKSLNSKQLDLSVRLPQQYREAEMGLRGDIAQRLERGKVEATITVEANETAAAGVVNVAMARRYKEMIEEMSTELGVPTPADWSATLLRMPDVLKPENRVVGADEVDALRRAVGGALDGLVEFRTQEGARLEKFFEEKIEAIQGLLLEVPQYEGERIERIRGRIFDALEKLQGVDYDKNRFEQEMIFYIEKLDITEEKIRLQNHLDYFLKTMKGAPGQGKKLGFITQEMGREINTLGSKANHAELQRIVVRMKDHLEQIKEQILNVM